jgi:cysteinyl-tRNA synthetase
MKFLGLYSSYQNTDKRKINNFSYDAFIVQNLVELREEAKKNKDWAEADRIREKLGSLDIIIEDTKSGSIIRHKPRSLS